MPAHKLRDRGISLSVVEREKVHPFSLFNCRHFFFFSFFFCPAAANSASPDLWLVSFYPITLLTGDNVATGGGGNDDVDGGVVGWGRGGVGGGSGGGGGD